MPRQPIGSVTCFIPWFEEATSGLARIIEFKEILIQGMNSSSAFPEEDGLRSMDAVMMSLPEICCG